jgi:hypothetical protein
MMDRLNFWMKAATRQTRLQRLEIVTTANALLLANVLDVNEIGSAVNHANPVQIRSIYSLVLLEDL